MGSFDKSFKDSYSVNVMDPNLWDRLVWQRAFDKALREKIAKQHQTSHVNKNTANLRTH